MCIRDRLLGATEEQLKILAENEAAKMRQMDCYIGVRGEDNLAEMSDVPEDKLALYDKLYMNPVHHEIRVPHTKWVVLRYPCLLYTYSKASKQEAHPNLPLLLN